MANNSNSITENLIVYVNGENLVTSDKLVPKKWYVISFGVGFRLLKGQYLFEDDSSYKFKLSIPKNSSIFFREPSNSSILKPETLNENNDYLINIRQSLTDTQSIGTLIGKDDNNLFVIISIKKSNSDLKFYKPDIQSGGRYSTKKSRKASKKSRKASKKSRKASKKSRKH